MRESGKSIVIAAQMAGFATQSHFTKAFRTMTGATPRAWLRDVGTAESELTGCIGKNSVFWTR